MKWYEKQKKAFEQNIRSQEGSTLFNERNDAMETIEPIEHEDYVIDHEPMHDNNSINDAYLHDETVHTACDEIENTCVYSDILIPEKTNINYIDDDKNSYDSEEITLSQDVITPINTALSTVVKGTQVFGDIHMDGFLDVYGDVIGDITCSGDIQIYGNLEGAIVCQNLFVYDANIVGDITCTKQVHIQGGSNIRGSITSKDLTNEGSIVGNLQIQDHITLTKHAVVDGALHSKTLEVEKGASVKGLVTTS